MPPLPIRWVLVRDPQGKFEPQALLCTDLTVDPVQILEWFVLRWRLEVTWQEARAHLGMETQRQWNERAIARTTPALLGLFSIVTLVGRTIGPRARAAGQTSRVVSQTPADLCRCHRHGAPALVDLYPFLHVTDESRHGGNPLRTAEPLDRYPLLCGLNG